jgi:hypothetical protein
MKNQTTYILLALAAVGIYFYMNKNKKVIVPITPGTKPELPPSPGTPTSAPDVTYPGTTEDAPMPYVPPKQTAPKTETEDTTGKKGTSDSELAGLY